ncbi:MAG: HAD family hydrolase [Bacteroidales bacterium]|nr:HAD family hydrolase [Bacteroidales bacterium]MCM1415519.1 HAD family hydrolase [bacterium]MCM1423719.1 HAD family hydrolase [bacterium]
MIKALFVDFYGTIVHEDGVVVDEITTIISNTGDGTKKSIIGGYWWQIFQESYMNSFGNAFKTQRELEIKSLEMTLKKFSSNASAEELSRKMFEHWRKPPIFEDAVNFLALCDIPYYIVSNIDTDDVMAAIRYHALTPAMVFTSEDAKSYKPRSELFELALRETNLNPQEVVHVGDSLNSDIKGASNLGINTIWINRNKREIPDGVISIASCTEIFDTPFFSSVKM